MPLEITPVRGRADLKAFIELPYRLHAGTPWIPPLKLERHAYLSVALNPFFKHGEAEYFLARRDGVVVGRITAQYDRNFNDFHNNRWGFFGFLEFEEDQEILDALLDRGGRLAHVKAARPHDRPVRLHHQRGVRHPDRGL